MVKAKAPDELTEGEKIAEEFIDLLENENAKEEEIRRKIDALQRAREKARKQLPEARKELAAVLTSPRQEAVLLLMGYID
jgi:membrane-bound ClpP family serine protease